MRDERDGREGRRKGCKGGNLLLPDETEDICYLK